MALMEPVGVQGVVSVYRVADVAEFLLDRSGGPMSSFKLQKLVYYAQAWSLASRDRALFPDEIEAWVNGPVVRSLYELHKRSFWVSTVGGDAGKIGRDDARFLSDILSAYGQFDPQTLVRMTHREGPWIEARGGKPLREHGSDVISRDSMRDFYRGLLHDPRAKTIDY